MTQTVTFQSKPSVVACELDGGSVLLDLETSKYFALNAVGLFVWEQIATAKSAETLCDAVASKFDVSTEVCGPDIDRLLQQLDDRRLVSRESGSPV